MSLFWRRSAAEARAISPEAFIRGDELAGYSLTSKALRLTPVYAAVSLLADGVASLPLQAYRLSADGARQRADLPPLFRAPAAQGTVYDWIHRAMVSLLLRGNAYGLITSSSAGWPSTIEWLHPDRVRVDETQGSPRYYVDGRFVDRAQIVHVAGFAMPGSVIGLSPIEQYAMTLELGLAAQKSARDWFKNGITPSTDITIDDGGDGTVDATVARNFKDRYKANLVNGDPFVHGSAVKVAPIGVSAADARFLEAIAASATHVAAIYKVAPEDIGGTTGSSMTYSTTELNEIKFQTRSLRPWATRLEQVFAQITARPIYMRFNFDANIRTETKTRWETHQIALATGARTINEIRHIEDLPPVEWGDKPYVIPTPAAPAAAAPAPRSITSGETP